MSFVKQNWATLDSRSDFVRWQNAFDATSLKDAKHLPLGLISLFSTPFLSCRLTRQCVSRISQTCPRSRPPTRVRSSRTLFAGTPPGTGSPRTHPRPPRFGRSARLASPGEALPSDAGRQLLGGAVGESGGAAGDGSTAALRSHKRSREGRSTGCIREQAIVCTLPRRHPLLLTLHT